MTAGFCGGTDRIWVARAALHYGEEPCISGTMGSGAIFFSGCSLRCCFCQNASISRGAFGAEISVQRLSDIFLELQEQGAHNINLVTPSHYAPLIAEALRSVQSRLRIPVICNCSGYESAEILREFDGLVDLYLPDLKYFSPERSARYSAAPDYFSVAALALPEMFRQVGRFKIGPDGLIRKGLLVRHLVLPGGKDDSIALLHWLAKTFPKDQIRVSLMRQYSPCGDLNAVPELKRKLFSCEYDAVLSETRSLGLAGYCQGRGCDNLKMTPLFDLTGVEKEEII